MYLTSGQYKGRKIIVPQGVKPTLSKTRQGVFNMLNQFNFSNNSFLDMFSGSGLIGLEAISRGYRVLGLENNKNAFEIIKKNYKALDLPFNIKLINALNFKTDEKFDVVYLDPPWVLDYQKIIEKALELIENNGIIVVEYDALKKDKIEEIFKNNKIEIIKNKKYGRSLIALLSLK